MNRREAIQLDSDIREYLEVYSKKQSLSPLFGDMIVNQYLEIMPDDVKRDMIFLGKESESYKLGNIRLDLKSVLLAIANFVASLNQPENLFQYLQLVIITILCVGSIIKKDIDYNCTVILYALHQLNAYEVGITTEKLKMKIMSMKEKYQMENFEMERLERNINELYEWNVIRIIDEKIFLNERVWGNLK